MENYDLLVHLYPRKYYRGTLLHTDLGLQQEKQTLMSCPVIKIYPGRQQSRRGLFVCGKVRNSMWGSRLRPGPHRNHVTPPPLIVNPTQAEKWGFICQHQKNHPPKSCVYTFHSHTHTHTHTHTGFGLMTLKNDWSYMAQRYAFDDMQTYFITKTQ